MIRDVKSKLYVVTDAEGSKQEDFHSDFYVSLICALVMISLVLLLDVVAFVLYILSVSRWYREGK